MFLGVFVCLSAYFCLCVNSRSTELIFLFFPIWEVPGQRKKKLNLGNGLAHIPDTKPKKIPCYLPLWPSR